MTSIISPTCSDPSRRLPLILGCLGAFSSAGSLACKFGYGVFASRAMMATARRLPGGHDMAVTADRFSLGSLLLGVAAVALSLVSLRRAGDFLVAGRIARGGLGAGIVAILLWWLILI